MKFFPFRKHHRKKPLVSPEETFVDSRNLPGFDMTRFEGTLERPIKARVFLLAGAVFIAAGLILAGRAAYLTLVRGDDYAMRSQANHMRPVALVPERGVIYDRNGIPLAFNIPGFRVVVDTRVADLTALSPLVADASRLLGVQADEMDALVKKGGGGQNGEIVVAFIREWEMANRLIAHFKNTNAIRIEPTPLRAYESHPAFSHLIGYMSRVTQEDIEKNSSLLAWGEIGRSGIERAYDDVLRGALGVRIIETDSNGAVLSEGIYQKEERGQSVMISISAEMQKVAYEAIGRIVEERGFTGGSAAILDARTGAVMSLVSYPGYNPNVLTSGAPAEEIAQILTGDRKPLFFRAIAGLYPPASTVKPFLAAAAITEGIIDPQTPVYTNGRLVIPNPYNPGNPTIFRDWKNHGTVNMLSAIAVSSDVYFYILGGGFEQRVGLGQSRIASYLKSFGIGAAVTGIDIKGEENGIMPDEAWKAGRYPDDPVWRVGDTYNISIGQGGMIATPLQMARATAAVARDGALMRPYLVEEIARNDGSHETRGKPQIVGHAAVSPEALAIVQEGMREAVIRGTASGVASIPIPVAAKTGTAEIGKTGRVHSWFIGFLPLQDPELAIAINLENGSASNLVGATAVAHEILRWYADGGRETIFGNE